MDRRNFIVRNVLGSFLLRPHWGDELFAQGLPIERGSPSPESVPEPHFPDRLHLFVWRNWELANADRMAKVLGTTPEIVLEVGASMGLPAKRYLTEDQLRRIYITVIRQNWHVLPDDQLMELLCWEPQRYEYTLKEDDFLWVKLGLLKPHCERLQYEAPSPDAQRRAAEIRRQVRDAFGSALEDPGEPPFQFVADLSSKSTSATRVHARPPAPGELDPRYVYSYFALYGDPLMDAEIDPFPHGFLERLSGLGVNGVWLQGLLRALAPSTIFPEFGAGGETRLKHLSRLVERAQNYGVKIYLYLNEPRSMPAEFFDRHPDTRGTHDARDPEYFALCTSVPKVRDWLAESLAHVFSQVPGLGGIFCITASENLTNCYSHGQARYCPRCSKRTGAEVVGELIRTFREGVRRSSADAKVIAWDWGWQTEGGGNGADAAGIIERLPKDVALLSVSEWDAPVERGGFHTKVGEYSISVVGPGPRALRHWSLARQHGLYTMAKVQWNATWEISAVPYIPVPNLIVRHCENLRQAQIQGLMLSWTVGGYPSPNFDAAQAFYFSPAPDPGDALRQVAERRYGKKAAPEILHAWETISRAFEEFPYGVAIYTIPTQHGPANPLRLHSTGYKAGMILFPYDDYKGWAGPYPLEIVEAQFAKMAAMWEPGLESFRHALARVPPDQQAVAQKDLGIAETCHLHFRSVANQLRFYLLRAQWESASDQDRAHVAGLMIKIAEDEMRLARRQYDVSRKDSTIAYEASNHYYYRPLDLAEKVLNCQQVVAELRSSAHLEIPS